MSRKSLLFAFESLFSQILSVSSCRVSWPVWLATAWLCCCCFICRSWTECSNSLISSHAKIHNSGSESQLHACVRLWVFKKWTIEIYIYLTKKRRVFVLIQVWACSLALTQTKVEKSKWKRKKKQDQNQPKESHSPIPQHPV